jgi:addiction module HigA family antidote
LLIITEEIRMAKRNGNRLPPIHPGEILREEFLKPLGMSAPELAVALCVPATRINEIVNERRGISASTALRLSRYFGTTPKFWLNLQGSYELEAAQDRLGKSIQREVLPRSA